MSHRLKTSVDVRRFLQRVINEVYEGSLDPKTANSIYNGCNVLLSSIRTDEMQPQIDDIMQKLEVVEGKANMRRIS